VGLFEQVHAIYSELKSATPVPIRVQGWGCDPGIDPDFNSLYLVNAEIDTLPDTSGSYYTTTSKIRLCPGDSGGGAFFPSGAVWRLFAVNSRVEGRTSNLATTSYAKFTEWAKTWGNSHSAFICGLHAEAEGCRP
jgi:hypothetical protein